MNNLDARITEAIKVLEEGGIVIYPTDTAFGIGCRIDRTDTVDRLFQIRRRPTTKAMPVLVNSTDMALAYYDHPLDIVRRLLQKYWPGALTVVSAAKKERIYSPIRGGGNSVGLRMPDHAAPLALITGIGVPILGPSANLHGRQTPFTGESLDPELIRLVDYVVPGECTKRAPSTVIDCTAIPAAIVRQGAIKLEPEELV